MQSSVSATPPIHTGALNGIVWGALVSGALGVAGAVAFPAAAPLWFGIAADIAGVAAGTKIVLDKRDEYRESVTGVKITEKPPIHTGVIEGAVWGTVIGTATAVAGITTMVAGIAIGGPLVGIPLAGTGIAAGLLSGVVGGVAAGHAIIEKRDEWQEAHPVIAAGTASLQGRVLTPEALITPKQR